jgi:ureidoglycolate hydrolase
LLWHANYHPDGGQLFFPIEGTPFVTPLALPGDDISPDKFVNFYFDGTCGLYIHPNIWHEGIFPLSRKSKFFDKQGSVHARVSVNFAKEFGVFMDVRLGG